MKYSVFGRKLEIVKDQGKWIVFILGTDNKKRIANDIFIPSDVRENDLVVYLDDLLHEWATSEKHKIYKIE